MLSTALLLCIMGCSTNRNDIPEKHISKLYASHSLKEEELVDSSWITTRDSTTPQALCEQWNWHKGRIRTVDYYNYFDMGERPLMLFVAYGGPFSDNWNQLESSLELKYGRNRLEYVHEVGGPKAMAVFLYDQGKVKQVYQLDDLVNTVEYDGKQVRRITVAEEDGSNPATYDFTWVDGNITHVAYCAEDDTGAVSYTYDDKQNPFRGYFLGYIDVIYAPLILSRNNPTTIVRHALDASDTIRYSYTYDGQWPTIRTQHTSHTEATYRSADLFMTYIEYAD